ncbi:MAG: hypothetical protein ABIV47_20205 [Roseiflexaceae bacterium]
MRIACVTPQAAAQALTILYGAQLQLVRDFELRPVLSTTLPLIFTMLVRLPAAQVRPFNIETLLDKVAAAIGSPPV